MSISGEKPTGYPSGLTVSRCGAEVRCFKVLRLMGELGLACKQPDS
ncbi:hypothetical protein MRBBS_3618 [Marinobacter sp. BSs20148]|nr:hypothetical protein MRBBS_3618 [Marinobacter sp. BSs20148]